jgi:hypothetical protein
MQLRCELLGILNRARIFLRQVLVARRLLLREYQRRPRLTGHLRRKRHTKSTALQKLPS